MCQPMQMRQAEVTEKLAQMRRWLLLAHAGAIRLRGVDWFSWAIAGGINVVVLGAETGSAQLLVTEHHAYVLTDHIEAQRLQDEEVTPGWDWHVTAWAESQLRERFVADVAAKGVVISDRPVAGEHPLPPSCKTERLILTLQDQQRMRLMSQKAAGALSDVYRAFEQAHCREGYAHAIREHHQGGIAGYLPREVQRVMRCWPRAWRWPSTPA